MSNDSTPSKLAGYHVAKFSLASILLLTAVVAIFLGGIRAGLHDTSEAAKAARAFGGTGGLLVGMAVGMIIGAGQPSRTRGSLSGLMVGMLAGAGAGLLMATPQSLIVIIPGTVLLLAFAVLVRWLSRATAPRPETPGEGS